MEVRKSGRVTKTNPLYSGSLWDTPAPKKPKKLPKPKETSPAAAAAAAAAPEEPLAAAAAAASTAPLTPLPPTASTSEKKPKDSAHVVDEAADDDSDSAPVVDEAADDDDDSASDHTDSSYHTDGPLSEKQQIAIVKKAYTDIKFPACYGGIQSIKRSLLSEKNLRIPERIIAKALNEFSDYVKNLPTIKRYPRSRYDVSSLGQLWQADLAFVGARRQWNGFTGFLLCIDCFSVRAASPVNIARAATCACRFMLQHKIFTRPIKEKSAKNILSLFDDCVREAGYPVDVLQTDR
jgi:hypothetical protein